MNKMKEAPSYWFSYHDAINGIVYECKAKTKEDARLFFEENGIHALPRDIKLKRK